MVEIPVDKTSTVISQLKRDDADRIPAVSPLACARLTVQGVVRDLGALGGQGQEE